MKSVANLLVAQSGGPTAVVNSSLAGIVEAAQQSRIDRIIGLNGGLEGLFQGRPPFDLSGLDEPQLEALPKRVGVVLL